MNISKELLSEILQYKVGKFHIDTSNSTPYIDVWLASDLSGINDSINIYELAHKCKEWALNKNYSIATEFMRNEDEGDWFICIVKRYTDEAQYIEAKFYDEPTEPEAIFKSCKWILDNKDK